MPEGVAGEREGSDQGPGRRSRLAGVRTGVLGFAGGNRLQAAGGDLVVRESGTGVRSAPGVPSAAARPNRVGRGGPY